MASPRKSERLISSRGHGCFTISPPQLPATATRFPSHGSGRPGLVLQTATKLSSVGFEPTAVLTFGLRVRRLNHSATRSVIYPAIPSRRNRRFSAESPFRKPAKTSENTKQDFPLFSFLAIMTLGCFYVFCPHGRMEST